MAKVLHPPAGGRILWLDLARSLALAAMVSFHFGYDLELFGLLAPGTTRSGFWWWYARGIAGSFLFLAGISLWLAHGRGIRWPAFWWRFLRLAGAALLVSLATAVAMPEVFVYYGILHSIALSSLAGLLFLRLPAALVLGAAALIFWIGNSVQLEAFSHPALWWTGLAGHWRPSMDFEPFFPWMAALLAGMGLARLFDAAGIWRRLAGKGGPLVQRLGAPGRHSLVIYLVHQPLLLGLFSAGRWLGLV